jgi:hypothetical protein
MAAVDDRDVVECPQVAGDALLLALADEVERPRRLAQRCVEILRERDWSGDVELADVLQAALDPTPVVSQPLVAVPVDLEDVVDALRGDATFGGGRLDLRSGEVILNLPFAELGLDEEEDEGEDDDWLAIGPLGSRPG